MSGGPPDNRGPVLFLVFLVMAALIAVAWGLGRDPQPRDGVPLGPGGGRTSVSPVPGATPRAVGRPDVHRVGARFVDALESPVRFVSYQ